MKNAPLINLPLLLLAGLLVLWLSLPVDAASLDPLLSEVLTHSSGSQKIPVIVRVKDSLDLRALRVHGRAPGKLRAQARANLVRSLKARAQRDSQPLRRLLKKQGIAKVRDLWLINGLALEATVAQINEMAALPGVSSLTLDGVITPPEVVAQQVTGTPEWNLSRINAPALWSQGYAGSGVTVAIVDSGVDGDHPDLAPRWRGGSNSWFDPNGEHPLVPTDVLGHGTNVAGVIVGGDNGGTVIGVAPEAQWIAVKIFADNDTSSYSNIHAGFQWLLDPDGDPDTDDAPDIVNNSWGFDQNPNDCGVLTQIYQPDVQALKAAGIAVVFSAGNTGPSSDTSIAPASYPESFAVGSVGTFNSFDEISDFSARGPSACDVSIFPEIVAPGFFVRTSSLYVSGDPNPYIHAFGTSFAAPHVSGAMALLLNAFPGTPVDTLELALTNSAVELGDPGAENVYGYGLVDVLASSDYLAAQTNLPGQLLLPNGGEVLIRGMTYKIQWQPDPAADNYRLHYFDADGTAHPIAVGLPGSSFYWTIPLDTIAEPGKNLRVTSFSGNTKLGFDFSDAAFSIQPHLFPNGGETLKAGMTYTLMWASVNGADSYRLHYFDADGTPHPIGGVSNITSFPITIPLEVPTGEGKVFRVTPFNGSTRLAADVQWSDGTFSIASPMFPNGGEVLTIGTSYPLSWAQIPGADSYRLHYFDGDGTPHPIAAVGNTTTHDWLVPVEASPGDDKTFRVTPFAGTTRLGSSLQFSAGSFTLSVP